MTIYAQMKLAVVGKEGVGKTVLTHRLMRKHEEARVCLEARKSTTGVRHEQWVNPLGCSSSDDDHAKQLVLIVWDYAGQHAYRGTHQCFFTRQSLYILVFDLSVDEKDSAACGIQWMFDIHDRVPGAVFALVGNKADLLSQDEARRKYQYVLGELRNASLTITESPPLVADTSVDNDWIVSCTDGDMPHASIDRLREAIVRKVILVHRDRFPILFQERPEALKRILEAMFRLGNSQPIFVLKDDIRREARVMKDAELEIGLRFWHEVGMCLWYGDSASLREYVFHDPTQISELLKVLIEPQSVDEALKALTITDPQHQCLVQGQLMADTVPKVWKGLYESLMDMPSQKCFPLLVLSLLERLDLAFEAPPSEGAFFVPLVLNARRSPADIIRRAEAVRGCTYSKPPVYMLRVKCSDRSELPHGLFERLLARMYRAWDEMIDDCEVPCSREASNHGAWTPRDWRPHRNCLTCSQERSFCLYPEHSEIVLRVNCKVDNSEFRPESRCFAKRVWDALRSIVMESYKGVKLCARIILEDWDRGSQHQCMDLKFALEHIDLDQFGFVKHPEQLISPLSTDCTTKTAARDLWPLPIVMHRFYRANTLDRTNTFEIVKEKMTFFSTIGSGGFGTVYRAAYDGYRVAIKQLELIDEKSKCYALNEVKIHCGLCYRTLLRTFGFCVTEPERVYLVLEYARYGSLKRVLRQAPVSTHSVTDEGIDVSLRQRVVWLKDVADAVEFLHQRKVIHRDIKCDNVMLREDMTALLGDLGLARIVTESENPYTEGLGTAVFRAPEVDIGNYTLSADIYSFGITAVQILTAYTPGSREFGLQDVEKLYESSECNFEPNELFGLKQLHRIVEHCTIEANDQRPSAVQVQQWLGKLLEEWDECGQRVEVPPPPEPEPVRAACRCLDVSSWWRVV
jgi:GTPase SAR1 family protein